MPMDRFLIAPLTTGLQTDLKPWLIPDDAFSQLNNAYVFRGRVRKRFGSAYMGMGPNPVQQALGSRLGIQLYNFTGSPPYLPLMTDAFGNVAGTVLGNIFKIGQGFSIGNTYYTVYQDGTPANMLRNDGVNNTATYNTTTGGFIILGGPANEPVYFYPAEPVMGLALYEIQPINNQPTFAFDTQFAYEFLSGFWQYSGVQGYNTITDTPTSSPQWHGTNTNFFWVENWDGVTPNVVVMFVSNFNAHVPAPLATDDPIWSYNNGIWAVYSAPVPAVASVSPLVPAYTIVKGDGTFIFTARIIVNFKNRLLLLNTIEQIPGGINNAYVNRCRYSHNGSPFSQIIVGSGTAAAIAPYAWLEPNQTFSITNGSNTAVSIGDGGGFIDATTEEAIISSEFIKDRLIVYFERSTWELAYTGNEIIPFVWQKLNTELGSEAPNSTVPFDKVILTIGSTGVHACNGSNVERIDTKIPEQIFEIDTTNQQVQRVCGIRDYYVEMVYWAFPSIDENPNDVFPNRILVYNYRNNSWSFNDDCITCFGYFEQESGLTWENANYEWEIANTTWNSGVLEAQSRQVIAGNQEGFVFLVQADTSYNAPVMQLTGAINQNPLISMPPMTTGLFLTIVDHTLQIGDFIYITNSSQDFLVPNATGVEASIFKIEQVLSPDVVFINGVAFPIDSMTMLPELYTGGAFVARVSKIDIYSKQWNPYVDKGRDVYLAKIDFNVLKTTNGQVTVDYFPSYANNLSMLTQGMGTGSIMGTGVLELSPYARVPLENYQDQLWHQVYFQTQGSAIQIRIYYSDVQMLAMPISFSDFEIEGMILHTQATSVRVQ